MFDGEASREHAVLHQGNDAGFFRDHDGQRVGPLGDADGGPVSQAQAFLGRGRGQGLFGQGQDAGRGVYPSPPHEHRAVVQGGVGEEDLDEEFGGGQRIQEYPGGSVFAQAGLAFHHDERADAVSAHVLHRLGDGLDDALLVVIAYPHGHKAQSPQAFQGLANLRCENDGNGHQQGRHQVAHQPGQGRQTDDAEHEAQHESHHQGAPQNGHALGVLKPGQNDVENQGDQQDVQQTGPVQPFQNEEQLLPPVDQHNRYLLAEDGVPKGVDALSIGENARDCVPPGSRVEASAEVHALAHRGCNTRSLRSCLKSKMVPGGWDSSAASIQAWMPRALAVRGS